jgi:hypothetical protein
MLAFSFALRTEAIRAMTGKSAAENFFFYST